MSFVPYLHFQGDCAEAMRFYAEVFGATDLEITTYADAPGDIGFGPSERVMHASLTTAGGALMASDFPEGMDGDPQKAVSVMHPVDDAPSGQALFDRLLRGGDVILPFGATFWSAGFGMVRDRFGTHWMIAAPANPQA